MGRFWFSGASVLHSRGSRHRPSGNALLVADLQHRPRVGADDGRGTRARVAYQAGGGDLPAGRAQAQA
nr:hypothetical protein [Xanthomonas campestris]